MNTIPLKDICFELFIKLKKNGKYQYSSYKGDFEYDFNSMPDDVKNEVKYNDNQFFNYYREKTLQFDYLLGILGYDKNYLKDHDNEYKIKLESKEFIADMIRDYDTRWMNYIKKYELWDFDIDNRNKKKTDKQKEKEAEIQEIINNIKVFLENFKDFIIANTPAEILEDVLEKFHVNTKYYANPLFVRLNEIIKDLKDDLFHPLFLGDEHQLFYLKEGDKSVLFSYLCQLLQEAKGKWVGVIDCYPQHYAYGRTANYDKRQLKVFEARKDQIDYAPQFENVTPLELNSENIKYLEQAINEYNECRQEEGEYSDDE